MEVKCLLDILEEKGIINVHNCGIVSKLKVKIVESKYPKAINKIQETAENSIDYTYRITHRDQRVLLINVIELCTMIDNRIEQSTNSAETLIPLCDTEIKRMIYNFLEYETDVFEVKIVERGVKITDINKRKKLEEERRKKEEEINNFIDSLP